MLLTDFNIKKCANGFLIMPSWTPSSQSVSNVEEDFFVFRTAEELADFLRLYAGKEAPKPL